MITITITGETRQELEDQLTNMFHTHRCGEVVDKQTAFESLAPQVPSFTEGESTLGRPRKRVESLDGPTGLNIVTTLDPESLDMDITGAKWNGDIHSASKAKTKDGKWRVRKNLGVKELQVAPQAAIPTLAPPPAPIAAPPVPVTLVAAPAIAAPTPPKARGPNEYSFDEFKSNLVPIFSNLMRDGKITHEYVDSLKAYFGVKELWEIMVKSEQALKMYESFCETGLIVRAV